MRATLIVTLLWFHLLIGPSRAGTGLNAKDWRYYAPVEPASGTSARYAQVIIPRFVYGSSSLRLKDIRIIANGSMEVPYKLLTDAPTKSANGYNPRFFNKAVVPGKCDSFDLDLGKPGLPANQVDMEIPGRNFMRQVEIDGSPDGVHWHVVRRDGYIFDFSRDYRSRRTSILFPESRYQYYRLKIWNYDQKPLPISWVVMARQRSGPATEVLYYRGPGSVSQSTGGKHTDIVIALVDGGLPVSRVVIISPDMNYHRKVDIAVSHNGRDWTDFYVGQIMKYDTPKFRCEESTVTCVGAGGRYLRVRIHNLHDRPIRISEVRVYGYRQRLLIPYNSSATYRVYYGNREAESPVYDIEETFRHASFGKTVVLRLGRPAKNPEFAGPWLEQNPWIPWAVLVGAAVLLGLLTVRSVIATRQTPPQ